MTQTARVTKEFAQILTIGRGSARVTQQFAQVLSGGYLQSARVSQSFAQVLSNRPVGAAVGSDNPRPEDIIFVAKIQAIDDAGDPVVELATNSPGWRTKPSDTPAHQHVAPTLTNPGTYRREMFSGNRTFGAVRPSFGSAVLSNRDGRYDAMRTYGFDGQPYTVYWGRHGAAFPAGFQVAFKAVVTSAELDFDTLTLRLGDSLRLLEKPILNDAFDGTGGLEGATELAGTPRQRIFGDPELFPLQPVIQQPATVIYATDGSMYELALAWNGKPTASQEIFRKAFVGDTIIRFDTDFAPSSGSVAAATVATATATFNIKKNGSTIGQMIWGAAATSPTFSLTTPTNFESGDVLTVVAPSTPDSTLSGFSYTLVGYVIG